MYLKNIYDIIAYEYENDLINLIDDQHNKIKTDQLILTLSKMIYELNKPSYKSIEFYQTYPINQLYERLSEQNIIDCDDIWFNILLGNKVIKMIFDKFNIDLFFDNIIVKFTMKNKTMIFHDTYDKLNNKLKNDETNDMVYIICNIAATFMKLIEEDKYLLTMYELYQACKTTKYSYNHFINLIHKDEIKIILKELDIHYEINNKKILIQKNKIIKDENNNSKVIISKGSDINSCDIHFKNGILLDININTLMELLMKNDIELEINNNIDNIIIEIIKN